MCMCVSVSICHVCIGSQRPIEGTASPRTRLTGSCELSDVVAGTVILEEEQMLLTIELSILPNLVQFLYFVFGLFWLYVF